MIKERAKRLRKEAREFGLCVWCLRTTRKSTTYCDRHSNQHNQTQRRRYWEARNAGLCIVCRINTVEGKVRCEECRIKSNVHNRRYKSNARTN